MFEWVDKKLNLVYDGKKLPTFKLFSIQRINEYMQQWNAVDDANNPILNFKTITREVNPQKAKIKVHTLIFLDIVILLCSMFL